MESRMKPEKKSSSKKQKSYRLKPLSKSTAVKKAEYKRVCDKMDHDTLMRYDMIRCRACGKLLRTWDRSIDIMDHSHLLPKSTFPQYETDPGNIFHLCRKDHEALDRNDFSRIRNFRHLPAMMQYLWEKEPGEYNKYAIGLQLPEYPFYRGPEK